MGATKALVSLRICPGFARQFDKYKLSCACSKYLASFIFVLTKIALTSLVCAVMPHMVEQGFCVEKPWVEGPPTPLLSLDSIICQ